MDKREIRSRIRLRNAIPDSGDGLAGHTDIDACIGAALADISAEARWPWLLTTSSLTFVGNSASIPADCVSIANLAIGASGLPAERAELSLFIQQNKPWVWTEIGSNINLYPTPATAPTATLYYYKSEPELTTDTQVPLLPVTFHTLVVARGSYHLNVRRGDNNRVGQDLQEYQAGLRNLMQDSWRTSRPRTVQSSLRYKQSARW